MNSHGKMTVHPMVSPRYYGYYLQGFREEFGWDARLSTKGFPTLTDPKAGMAAVLPEGQRIFVAANDHAVVDPKVIAWADVVAQVNVDPHADRSPKVLPIGPSFGTPWSSRPSLAAFVIRAGVMTSPPRIPAMLRDYLRHQSDREPLAAYVPGVSDPTRLFFLANYWGNAPEANRRRLGFLQAAQQVPGISLAGGVWSPTPMPFEYEPFRLTARVPHPDYVARTRESALVFNTPAVHACLGWKLGEFLALGKAIVSTPLGREMPGRFAHGEHLHVVEHEAEMVEAIALIVNDYHYRATLERNARAYWESYLAPRSVARRIVRASLSELTGGSKQMRPTRKLTTWRGGDGRRRPGTPAPYTH